MPVTHEQRADVGLRYLAAIKLRIDVRTLAQKKALAETTPELHDTNEAREVLKPIAAPIIKRMGLRGEVAKLFVSQDHSRAHTMLHIEMLNRIVVRIPADDVAGLPAMIEKRKERRQLAKDLCQEIAFLHDFAKPTYIASFQAHVCRLWVPTDKKDLIPAARLNAMLEDFITAKRPAVCKVA